MKITFLRHGETLLNNQGVFCGVTDCDITDDAVKNAENIRFKNETFDYVYTSPLKRTSHTAKIVYPYLEPICSRLIIERNLGAFEGILKCSIDQKTLKDFRNNLYLPEGAETSDHVIRRVYEFIRFLKQNHNDNDKILVVSHNGIIRIINNLLLNNDTYSIKNLEYVELDLEEVII